MWKAYQSAGSDATEICLDNECETSGLVRTDLSVSVGEHGRRKGRGQWTLELGLPTAASHRQRHKQDTTGNIQTRADAREEKHNTEVRFSNKYWAWFTFSPIMYCCILQCLSRDASGKIVLQFLGTSVGLHICTHVKLHNAQDDIFGLRPSEAVAQIGECDETIWSITAPNWFLN